MPRIGRFVDDHGPRRTILPIGAGFGAVLAAIAGVRGIVTSGRSAAWSRR